MSEGYDTQPDPGAQTAIAGSENEGAKPERKSSGLIRAGIFGVILFLAVVGLTSVVSKWIFQPSGPNPEPTKTVQSPQPNGESPYKKLESVWLETRALLDTESNRKNQMVAKISRTETEITNAEQDVIRAGKAVTLALEGVEKAEKNHEAVQAKVSGLERDTPEEALEDAQLAANEAKVEVEEATAEFLRAKAEQKRIENTVSELKRAAAAAKAAATASRLVVSAAQSAQQAVNDNQDVMSSDDGGAMSNLENDFFKEAEQRANSVEKSARAAVQAVEVAEVRMQILKKQEGKLESRLRNAALREKDAVVVLGDVQKQIESHLKKLKDAEGERTSARKALEVAVESAQTAKTELDRKKRSVDLLNGQLKTTKEDVKRAEKTLAVVRAKFLDTETSLKALNRERAETEAVTMAALNAQLNENLRTKIGGNTPDYPVFDRLVLSSEKMFEPGSAELGGEGKKLLTRIAPTLVEIAKTVPNGVDWVLRVDGHTDNQPLSGNGQYRDNWELSQARALSVVRYLITTTSLKPTQLSANGFGEYQPLVAGKAADDLAKNRRIELTLTAR